MTPAARRAALITAAGVLAATASALTIGPVSARIGATRPTGPRPAAAGRAVAGHPAAVTPGQQAAVRRYWTRSRMEHATPLRPCGTRSAGTRSAGTRSAGTRSAGTGSAGRRRATGTQAGTRGRSGAPARTWLRLPVDSHSPQTGKAPRPAGKAPLPAGEPVRPAGQPQRTKITVGRPLAVPPEAPLRALLKPQFSTTTSAAAWTGGGAVERTTGKVFFAMDGHDYVCSGSTVASADADVVITAGHCVKDGHRGWVTDWTFVPGYTDGQAPYGSFTASQFYVATQWSTHASNDYDVAFVTLNPDSEDGTPVAAAQEVGGQGIEFGVRAAQETAFGYPAEPPYDGQQLYYCGGAVRADPYHETSDMGLTCAMTAGSSGGPWLAGFDPATGTGEITLVSSFKYSTNDQILYGPSSARSRRNSTKRPNRTPRRLSGQRERGERQAARLSPRGVRCFPRGERGGCLGCLVCHPLP